MRLEQHFPDEHRALEASGRLARGTGKHRTVVSVDELDGLVHDLRGPLLAIEHELALFERATEAGAQRSLRAVRGNLEFLKRLLLDVSVTTPPCSVSLSSLAEAVVARLPEAVQQRCHVEALARTDARVDPVRIERVLGNLVGNAVRYTDGAIVIRCERAGTMARVSVIDSGPGMSAELAARVFERGATGERGGEGLGLYLARTIVESYGGRIGVEIGEGTRFYFEIPRVAPETVTRSRAKTIVASSILCGASVLLVDDDLCQLRALAEILRAEHVSVVTATSAPECLIRVMAQRPEVIVLDLHLPGSDAVTLTRNVSMIDSSVPFILTTGMPSDHPTVTRTLAATQGWFLPKPFDPGELFTVLEQALIAPRRTR